MEVRILDSGSCRQIKGFALKGEGYNPVSFPTLFGEINHPEGRLLFDTGYSSHFLNATQRLPYRFYRLATPVSFGLSAKEQVRVLWMLSL